MIASFEGHGDIVRLLVEAKAQLNIQAEVYMQLTHYIHHHIYAVLL